MSLLQDPSITYAAPPLQMPTIQYMAPPPVEQWDPNAAAGVSYTANWAHTLPQAPLSPYSPSMTLQPLYVLRFAAFCFNLVPFN